MIESLVGGLLGAVTRTVPEVMKIIDRKAERAHEIAMRAADLESDKAKLAGQLAVASTENQQKDFGSALEALKASVTAQGEKIGNALVDGINALVRPTVTYIIFSMWTMIKCVTLIHVIHTAISFDDLARALPVWWTIDDQAMLAAVLNFWFLGRVFDKALK